MNFFKKIINFFYAVFWEKSDLDTKKISYLEILRIKDYTDEYNEQLEKNYLDSVVVAREYEEVKNLLKSYKYTGGRHLSLEISKIYTGMIGDYFQGKSLKNTIIVAVPTHWRRWIWRGFDHMKIISQETAKNLDIRRISLLSTSYTPQQSKLSKKERLHNKKDAFKIKKSIKIPENVILIDDVISTGSTINECAKILKKHGVKKVYGFFLARN
ncbi:ComF family protein [Candidatus Gracilibacteria bacterium]|nr:ComF family protein [Candidatus Gracilibacteria bacterium]